MGDEDQNSNSSSISINSDHHQMPKPPSLSFSIARLINKIPETSVTESRQPSAVPANPVYPIPMWAPSSNSRTLPSAPLPASQHLNQMLLRGMLHNSGFANETVATLMRHYQQLYGQHNPLLLAGSNGQLNFPSPSSHVHQLLASSAGQNHLSNLHKVEILRSAAAAASLHHRPIPTNNGKINL